MRTNNYRPDIDGLRAIAVISVVFFHVFPKALPGGFVGVDIFFVISGFLISQIIFSQNKQGTFSFSAFYERRIRRIFPALIVVLFACCMFGWFFLLANEYAHLGKHVASGSIFLSNFVSWSEANYFDNTASSKPLLHLWSLSIEEQFYIIWPLLIFLLAKWRIGSFWVLIALIGICFYLNVSGIGANATATFYSPQTRFWEILTGATLAWFAVHHNERWENIKCRLGSWLACIGIMLLFCALALIKADSDFPGFWAVLPVAAATLIIFAGRQCWINRHLLGNRLLVWFGLISFPLYLWHWPLLSFAYIINGSLPDRDVRWMLLVLSVLLAWLTYRYPERVLRYGGGHTRALILLSVLTGIAVLGLTIYKLEGLPDRGYHKQLASYAESIKRTHRASECFDIIHAYKKEQNWYCNLGNPKNPTVAFLYGDSHALSLIPVLEKYAMERKINVLFTGSSGCPSLLGIQSMRGEADLEKYNCRLLNERVYRHIKNSKIKKVLLVNRWTYYAPSVSRPEEFNPIVRNQRQESISKETSASDLSWAIENTVRSYRNIGVKVFLFADNPQQIHDPMDIIRLGGGDEKKYMQLSVSRHEHAENQQQVNKILAQQTITSDDERGGVEYINLDDIICNENQCPLVNDGKFLYLDDDHLSIDGALILYDEVARNLDK